MSDVRVQEQRSGVPIANLCWFVSAKKAAAHAMARSPSLNDGARVRFPSFYDPIYGAISGDARLFYSLGPRSFYHRGSRPFYHRGPRPF